MAAFDKGHETRRPQEGHTEQSHRFESRLCSTHFCPKKSSRDCGSRSFTARIRTFALEAFKLAHHYLVGKPVQPVVGEELAPPIKIVISAIPKFRVPAS
jgi:hypothetical protein